MHYILFAYLSELLVPAPCLQTVQVLFGIGTCVSMSSFYVRSSVGFLFLVSIFRAIVFYLSLVIFSCDSCLYQSHGAGEPKLAGLASLFYWALTPPAPWIRLDWSSMFTVHRPWHLPRRLTGVGLTFVSPATQWKIKLT